MRAAQHGHKMLSGWRKACRLRLYCVYTIHFPPTTSNNILLFISNKINHVAFALFLVCNFINYITNIKHSLSYGARAVLLRSNKFVRLNAQKPNPILLTAIQSGGT